MQVLDLFAGTGNLSIEALSRGADHAVLVDSSARSAAAIRENLRRLGLRGADEVWIAPVARSLEILGAPARTASIIIFLDPPYDAGSAPGGRSRSSPNATLLRDSGTLSPSTARVKR